MKKSNFYPVVVLVILIASVLFLSCETPAEKAEKETVEAFIKGDMNKAVKSALLWKVEDNSSNMPHAILSIGYACLKKDDLAGREANYAFCTKAQREAILSWSGPLLEGHPNSPYLCLLRGLAFEKLGDTPFYKNFYKNVSIRLYKRSIYLKPNFPLAIEALEKAEASVVSGDVVE